MKTITIRDLHLKTGKWVRHTASLHESVTILDRGRPAARLVPLTEVSPTAFAARKQVEGFDRLPRIETDSGRFFEEDRR